MTSGTTRAPPGELTLRHGDQEKTERGEQGDGPIDAAFWAVERITGIKLVCKDFRVRSGTLGRDAIGEVNLEVEYEGKSYRGVGVSTDSVDVEAKQVTVDGGDDGAIRAAIDDAGYDVA